MNQFQYGFKLPVSHTQIIAMGSPQRGDIALFRGPKHPDIIFVKRVIGLPGDHVRYHNHILSINGHQAQLKHCHPAIFKDPELGDIPVSKCLETLPGGIQHSIYENRSKKIQTDGAWVIPKHQYFMMGDNRDNSNDSRYWGTVPVKNFIGPARWVWMSFDRIALREHRWSNVIRWHHIGARIR